MNYFLSEMQEKDIISMSTGLNYGHIVDIKISQDGNIMYFIAENNKFFKRHFKNEEITFRFVDIEKIGKDVILVKI